MHARLLALPRFNSGYRGNSPTGQAFWEALYAAGADLVLSGDAHSYERFAPQDPRGNFDPARGIRAVRGRHRAASSSPAGAR